MITFGFELEVSDGAHNTLSHLGEMGLTQHESFHQYHCSCGMCEPRTTGPLFKAQQDCTADGEFISRILEFGSHDAERAIVGLSRALLLGGGDASGTVGNHVHVDRRGMDIPARNRLNRLFARYETELLEIASASRNSVRSYNGTRPQFNDAIWEVTDAHPEQWLRSDYTEGSKLSWKDPTVEFRLWNSTRAAWRIRTHVGLSVAMVLAATDGVTTTKNDPRCIEDVIGEYIDARTWAGILRQRFSKGGFSDIAT